MKNKKLILFTNEFPYGTWESYLETEVKYYDLFFENTIIMALQLRREHCSNIRGIPSNIKIIPIFYASKIIYFLYSFIVLFDKNLYKEIYNLLMKKNFNIYNLVSLFVFLSRSHYEVKQILKEVSRKELENAILYSYRFEYQPYVAMLLKKKLKLDNEIVARAHGYDLYENRRKNNYIPLRKIILDEVNTVYPVSRNGLEYIKNSYPNAKAKIEVAFLGTENSDRKDLENFSKLPFKIVSCSNVVPVKCIDKLVTVLSKIDTYEIIWTHYGDGILLDSIKELAKDKLPANIKAVFKGNIPNQKLLEEYSKNNYHLFINTSSSEGIPVSIMEANSFGIPCVATDVGGTKELVINGVNGFLLKKNFSSDELVTKILEFIEMDEEVYKKYRIASHDFWNKNFNASENYKKFLFALSEMRKSD